MDKIYDDIMVLKKRIEKQMNKKAKEVEILNNQINILDEQYYQLKDLLNKLNEWCKENQYYYLRSKLDKLNEWSDNQ